MNSEKQPLEFIREVRFESGDFFDQNKMVAKLDQLIQAWGGELLRNGHIDAIPASEYAWLEALERGIYLNDLKDQWEIYLVSCLIFFVSMREDIKRDFLLQPYNVVGQRLERWLHRQHRYVTPLSRDVITQFCLCYSLSGERKPIRVRYKEFKE
jgi:hypothetical protein